MIVQPAHRESNDPAIYLPGEPTDEEHAVVLAAGLHNGAHVPAHMIAKVAVRLHRQTGWSARIDGLWRSGKKMAAAVALSAATSVAAAYKSCQSAHDEKVAVMVRAEAAERALEKYQQGVAREFDRLDRAIDQLRTALLRLGISTPEPPPRTGPTSDVPVLPDQLSLFLLHAKGLDLCSRFDPQF